MSSLDLGQNGAQRRDRGRATGRQRGGAGLMRWQNYTGVVGERAFWDTSK